MFGGADAGDAIERFVGPEVKKIFHFDAAFAFQSRRANALARDVSLLRAEGESERLDPVVGRGVQDERAPAAFQIEQPLSGL